jgi:hypothetical protein
MVKGIVDRRRQKVVGRRHGMDIPRQMQVQDG